MSDAYGIETPIAEAIWEGDASGNRGRVTNCAAAIFLLAAAEILPRRFLQNGELTGR